MNLKDDPCKHVLTIRLARTCTDSKENVYLVIFLTMCQFSIESRNICSRGD